MPRRQADDAFGAALTTHINRPNPAVVRGTAITPPWCGLESRITMNMTHEETVGAEFRATNEQVLKYEQGSPERRSLEVALRSQAGEMVEIPLIIDGAPISTRAAIQLTAPHEHTHALARVSQAGADETRAAIAAAVRARADWSRWSLQDRAAIFLKAADLLAGPWRQRLNAATMLGQSKTIQQAEIDSACELIDFLRFNVQFAQEVSRMQPLSSGGVRNRTDYRPLEGFVYAVTPFNFTAIGGNLATAPVLMGNTVVWKPSTAASLSNHLFLRLLEEAGLPPGVINFLPGEPADVSQVVLTDPHFAGLHFTGSTAVFDMFWQQTARNLGHYHNYPRLVGETGGKGFVLAHPSADVTSLAVALVRGAFDYQGQKCSAASRAYVPASLWPRLRDCLLEMVAEIRMGDVRDLTNFMGAVIDKRAFMRIAAYIQAVENDPGARILVGGGADDGQGFFIQPTIIEVEGEGHRLLREEIFGPVLTVHVYEDASWDEVVRAVDKTGPYGLTGAIFAQDRRIVAEASSTLRFAAGNLYINDKPTGAVVGQQPFGGARRSGTNDKAGSALNLMRWTSPRTIKETHLAEHDFRYAHML